MENLILPNLLLIAGTGRNSGKTTMACAIIRKFSTSYPIIAVKISPHLHAKVHDLQLIFSGENFYIGEEIDDSKHRDSSRMLAAGARRSFFIMNREEQLWEAFQKVLSLVDHEDYIVCESGGLRNVVTPGLFFMMSNDNPVLKPNSIEFKRLCDKWITFDGMYFDFSVDSFEIQNNKWKLVR
jgi:hypothetical protein